MHGRCYDPTHNGYYRYGGRGITVHPDWHDFNTYLQYVLTLPEASLDLSLDRANNDGHYEPGNLRWVSARTQANNRRARATNKTGIAGLSRRARGGWVVDLFVDGTRISKESVNLDTCLDYLIDAVILDKALE